MKGVNGISVEVTEEGIYKGIRGNGECCPVAIALYDIVSDNVIIEVRTNEVCFFAMDEDDCVVDTLNYTLPPEARQFIAAFDMGLYVIPFSFKLPMDCRHRNNLTDKKGG